MHIQTGQLPDEGLKRVVGVHALAANVANNMIGAGIYVLPAIVAMQMGASGILNYLLCAVVLTLIVLCYLEVASRITTSGGSYAYVEAAFGPMAGFLVNSLFIFGWGTVGDAAVMNIVADSLKVFFPIFSNGIARAALFLFVLGIMVLVNVRGAKAGLRFAVILTIIKLIPLVAIIVFGFGYITPANLHWQEWPSLKIVGDTAIVLFFAFGGFETALNMSGEIKNSRRTVPLGVLLGVGLVLIIYLCLQTIVQGVLGSHIAEFKDAPLAAVADKMVGAVGGTLLLIAAIVSSLGNTSADVLSSPRLLFAGAKDGLFPKFLAKIHPKFATPYWSVIVYAGLIFLFSVSGSFKQLAILTSGALMLIYLSVVLSMIRLRMKKEVTTEKTFRVPGGYIIPIAAIASIIWFLSRLSTNELLSIVVFLVVFCVIYFAMKIQKSKKDITNE